MATPAVAPNVQTQTPEQIAEQLANQAVAQPASNEPAQLQREYVIETATGQVFKGKTQQELIDKLKQSVEHGTATIAELNRAKSTPPVQPATPQFDNNRYYEIWASDPVAANDYLMQTKYGVTMGDAVAAVRDANQFTQEVRPKTVIAEWQSQSDFPTTNPAEMDKAAGAMDTVWKEMFPQGAQVTPQNLEMVHSVCLRRGLYNAEGAQQQPNPVQQFAGGAPPPPPQSSSTMGGQQPTFDPARATPEQIRQFLENMPR